MSRSAVLNSDPNPLAQIVNLRSQAEKASKAGKLKAPEVDFKKLKKESTKKEEGFDDFNMDDLM